jgi:hypothetical protein
MTARDDDLRADLRALADRGTGTDLNPTRLVVDPKADRWWSEYLRQLDEQWRARLRTLLDAHEPATEPDLVTLTPEQVERFANAADAALRVRRAVLLLAAHATGGHVKQPHGDRCDDCGLTWPCVTVLRAAGPALNAIANLPSQEPATACRDAETATEPDCEHPNHGNADHDCAPFWSGRLGFIVPVARKAAAKATEREAPRIEDVLAAHAPHVGPLSGSWTCPPPCNAMSTNGSIERGDLTSHEERAAEHRAHVAQAIRETGAR